MSRISLPKLPVHLLHGPTVLARSCHVSPHYHEEASARTGTARGVHKDISLTLTGLLGGAGVEELANHLSLLGPLRMGG